MCYSTRPIDLIGDSPVVLTIPGFGLNQKLNCNCSTIDTDDRQTDGQIDMPTDRQVDRQTGQQIDRQTIIDSSIQDREKVTKKSREQKVNC